MIVQLKLQAKCHYNWLIYLVTKHFGDFHEGTDNYFSIKTRFWASYTRISMVLQKNIFIFYKGGFLFVCFKNIFPDAINLGKS